MAYCESRSVSWKPCTAPQSKDKLNFDLLGRKRVCAQLLKLLLMVKFEYQPVSQKSKPEPRNIAPNAGPPGHCFIRGRKLPSWQTFGDHMTYH